MIDLHTHILPFVDDGAADLETALAMGRSGEKQGIKVVAATPHFYSIPDWNLIKTKVEELEEEFQKANLGISLVAGAELFLEPGIMKMAPEQIPTYGDQGKYCLVEFSFHQISLYLQSVIFDLQTKGITPIIAHPERYLAVIQDPNIVLDWLGLGCLMQVNSGSVLGCFGSKIQTTAKIMLTHNMVHLLGSDGHNSEHRGLNLDQGYQAVAKILGAENAWTLVKTNPALILAGQFVEIDQPLQYKQKRRFFFF